MIELKNLTVTFSGGVKAIDNVSLMAPDGKNTIIIGESGSGKSVMLSAILRILPPSAQISGSILLDQKDILTASDREMTDIRRKKLAYIPQSGGNSLNPLLTVGYQIAEPLLEKEKVGKKRALLDAVAWMKKLGLGNEEQLADSYPHTLSGGMRQRALIAMGAIAGAQVLLADEPTKGLDGERIETVTDVLQELKGRTLLCVSHDLNFVRKIADYVCVMYAAQTVEICTSSEFFENPLHPYSRLTLEAMPENGLKAHMGFAPNHKEHAQMGCHFYERCPYCQERCLTPPPLAAIAGRKVRCWKYVD